MSWYSEIKIWAQSLEERWKQARSEGQDFALFATEAMKEHKFHENFILEKEIRNIMESSVYPYQVRPMSAFGEPPITLHFSKDEFFYLDLYIWMSASTSIHQHSFEGAFTVLQGTSIESDYEFLPEKALGESWLGKLEKRAIRKVNPGDVRTIHPNEKLIHRVMHLSRPTVSLVLRTHNQYQGVIQYSYDFGVLANIGNPSPQILSQLRVLKWYLQNGYIPTYQMVEPLIPYAELWNLLATYPHGHSLLNKLVFLNSNYDIVGGLSRQKHFHNLLTQMQTEEEKILFTTWEFFGKKWSDSISQFLAISPEKAFTQLKAALESCPAFEVSLKRTVLFKELYE